MHLARPRLTIRRLRLIVALAAVALTVGVTSIRLRRHQILCDGRARECRQEMKTSVLHLREDTLLKARWERHLGACLAQPGRPEHDLARWRARIAERERMIAQSYRTIAYWTDLAAKYDHLAARPWLSAPSDPLPP